MTFVRDYKIEGMEKIISSRFINLMEIVKNCYENKIKLTKTIFFEKF